MYRTASSYKTEICKINLTGTIQDNNIDYRAQFVALYYLIVVISVGCILLNRYPLLIHNVLPSLLHLRTAHKSALQYYINSLHYCTGVVINVSLTTHS